MSMLEALEKAKSKYNKMSIEQKREITKLVTGYLSPERVILNPAKLKKEVFSNGNK